MFVGENEMNTIKLAKEVTNTGAILTVTVEKVPELIAMLKSKFIGIK